jgi:hypothetical protein
MGPIPRIWPEQGWGRSPQLLQAVQQKLFRRQRFAARQAT